MRSHINSIVNPLTEEKYELLFIVRGRSPLSNANKPATIGATRTRVPTRTRVRFVVDRKTTGEQYSRGVNRRRSTVRISGLESSRSREALGGELCLAALARVTQIHLRWLPPACDGGTDWAIASQLYIRGGGGKEGTPYVREDFTDSLNSILECLKNHVASIGPLARNSEWCLTLKSNAAKDLVLCTGILSVRGCTIYVRSADKIQFSARVSWAPSFIPNAAIVNPLAGRLI